MGKEEYSGRLCSVFKCDTMKEYVCCADCPRRNQCPDPCLNHPSKCNLVRIQTKQKRSHPRRFTDEQAFKLWQKGYSDAEIGKTVGVSRQRIQTWRDNLELPSTALSDIDTSKYCLVKLSNGETAVLTDKK